MSERDARRLEALHSLLRKQDADLSEARLEFARIDAELERADAALRRASLRVQAVEQQLRERVSSDRHVAIDALARWRHHLTIRHEELEKRRTEHTRVSERTDAARARVAELASIREATVRLSGRTSLGIEAERRRHEYDALDELWLLGRRTGE